MPRLTALVTGSNSGIGFALASEFASRGIRVFATARKPSSLKTLVEQYPQDITPLQLDVTDPESITTLKTQIVQITNSRLDYLVNNAGGHYTALCIDNKPEKVLDLFNVNLFGVMAMCQAFTELLVPTNGTIVQIGSITRDVPCVFQSGYNASKAALTAYSDTLRMELAPLGVNVTEIVTAYVSTPLLDKSVTNGPSLIKVDEKMKSAVEESYLAKTVYAPLKAYIEKYHEAGMKNALPAKVYARRVLDKIVGKDRRCDTNGRLVTWKKSHPPTEIWDGADAMALYVLLNWTPKGLAFLFWYYSFKMWLVKL